jgi:hypothetical protein
MSVETVTRPAAFASLKETPPGPQKEPATSYCTFHGPQTAGNCEACDKEFPEAVKTRQSAAPSATVATADVQAIVDAAVKKAIAEQVAFQSWKSSEEGKAAAAAAPSAGAVPPDHGPPATGVPVNPTPVA